MQQPRTLKSILLMATALAATSIIVAKVQAADIDPTELSGVMDLKLDDVAGKKITLSSYTQDFIVVCFTSNTCPYSVDYEGRLKQLQTTFQKNKWSAVVVAINSNDHKDDTLEKMSERSKEQKFNFRYLKDDSQDVAKAFDAVYTPEFFVLNKQRQIVYQGALDDSTKVEDVTTNHVINAIEAIQQGGQPKITKTGARGCRIRFQRRRRKPAGS